MKWYLMRMCSSWLCPFKVASLYPHSKEEPLPLVPIYEESFAATQSSVEESKKTTTLYTSISTEFLFFQRRNINPSDAS